MNECFISGNTVKTLANNARRIAQIEDELNAAEIAEIFSKTQGSYSDEIVGVDEESNEDSSVYLIQEDTINVIANHMRRICNTADNLNAEEIADASSHIQGTVKDTGEYKVEAMNVGGITLKSGLYDNGEVFALPTLPENEKRIKELITQPDGSSAWIEVAEFDGWSASSPITANSLVSVNGDSVGCGLIMKPVNDELMIIVNIAEANTTITLQIYNPGVINWGDGTTGTGLPRYQQAHTYSNIGRYLITVPYNNNCSAISTIGYDESTRSLIECVYVPKWFSGNNGLSSSFASLINLKSVVLANGVYFHKNGSIFSYCTSLEYVALPNNLTDMCSETFQGSGIRRVILPYGITSVSKNCFKDCINLTNITIPATITTIGNSAFSECSSLESIVLPNGITTIGDSAFSECSSLESIVLPNGITTIGDYAFSECSSLESIVLPNGITTINLYTFKGCTNLANIVIPDSVTIIGKGAFDSSTASSTYLYNDKMKKLHLPSVTSIGQYAFAGLLSLESLVLSANTVCQLADTNGLFPSTYNLNIYVPDNLVNAYKTDANWSVYASKIKPFSEYVPE